MTTYGHAIEHRAEASALSASSLGALLRSDAGDQPRVGRTGVSAFFAEGRELTRRIESMRPRALSAEAAQSVRDLKDGPTTSSLRESARNVPNLRAFDYRLDAPTDERNF